MSMAQKRSSWVLLVDDNDLDAHLTVNAIHDCDTDIAIEVASNAEDALAKVRNRPYDLVICDFCLPGMNGLAFLKLAKKLRNDMRFILLTGYPSQELEAQVIHHGSCTYLSKSVDAQILSEIVKEALCPHEPAISI